MEPASLFVGSLTSFAVTELIKLAIKYTKAAVKCKSECEKLQDELEAFAPEVEGIERRLAILRDLASRTTLHDQAMLEDLEMVDKWLLRLKNAILAAKDDVHHCNSGRWSRSQHRLSVRLKAHFDTITRLGTNRHHLFLQLGTRLSASAPQAEVVPQYQHQQDIDWYNSPGEAALRKMADGANEARRLEKHTRLSMSSTSSSSGHGGWSDHGGWSEHGSFDYASGYSTDSPRAHLLQQGTQPWGAPAFHQDEKQHAEVHYSRRHTMPAGTQAQMAKPHGHDPLPASWKY